ncbi:armadillo segment polarity protein [Lepeophtheirus salmonis]|uniref:armadillo segment polarity protein n=1 Tax=Lepeophtheirus salmonis TaxID=72036 RepID=UPI001AE96918|nr:armadillo segment polarity protein-like [Lepeophtheirus salmonis]
MESEDYGSGVQPPSSCLDGKDQALLWQHGHYMGQESGFHSGSGTQNPSIVSGRDSDLLDPSISDVLSTHGSMYSEGGNSSVHGSFFGMSSSEAGQSCSSSGTNSSERMEEFIPTLTKILKDEDEFVVREALANIDKGSKKEYFLRGIMANAEIVGSIGKSLSGDEASIKSASNILRNMSLHKMGRSSITADPHAIPSLVRLLSSSVDRVLFCGITILHNLLIHQEEGAKRVMKEAGVLHKMTQLLKRDNAKLLTIVTDCLRILAYGNQQSKIAILEANGPYLLVKIMEHQQYEKLLMMTSRLLKVLSVCSKNKIAIIEAGGMDALAKQVGHPNSRLMHNCIWTLRNLSDAGTMIENIEPLISVTVQLLHHNDINIIICAAGIISNLTCNNQRNKIAVCHAGGINALVDLVKNYGSKNDCVEPAMCALRHLTNNHPEFETAQNVLCYQLGALPIIINVLHNTNYRPLIKAILGVIRNLAQRPSNQNALREHGYLHELAHLLRISLEDHGGPVDGVGVPEILEFTIGALLIFAKDSQNRILIRNIPKFVLSLLEVVQGRVSENIQRVTAGLICEIASDREGALCLYQHGAMEPVKFLLNSKNDKIASYATTIMYSLSSVPKQQMPQSHHQDWSHQSNMMNPPGGGGGYQTSHGPSRGYSNMAYDGGIPIEPMEGLGLGGTGFGTMDDDCMDLGGGGINTSQVPPPPNEMNTPSDIGFDWTDL